MLCVPLGRDQPFNADRVEALGLGTVLAPNSSTDELRQAIQDLLDDEEVRERAGHFSRSIEAHPGLEDALYVIDTTISNS
jgi:UDP:flavonoid glycosyltransferase YjiC (YdhE family)